MARNRCALLHLWIFISMSIISDLIICIHMATANKLVEVNEHCKCGEWNDELESRIVGGVKTNPHRYPWLAVLTKRGSFHCGGSVINNYYVLTAGHCVYNEETREMLPIDIFNVILGVYDRENENELNRGYYSLQEIKVPVLFHGDPMHDVHDLALLKLDRQILYTWAIKPVCLPLSQFTYVGKYGTISGWGTMSFKGLLSKYPREAAVQIISNESCMKANIVGDHFAENPKAMFCAYNLDIDACQGDSGGPMVIQEGTRVVQIGIISWGIECALKDRPGVYTRLTFYVDWIHNNTLGAQYCLK